MKFDKLKKAMIVAGFGVALGLSSNAGFAAQDSGAVNMSLTLGNTCTIDTTGIAGNLGVSPVGFDMNGGAAWGIGDLVISCGAGLNYGWGIAAGVNYDGMDNRLTDGGGNFIRYYLLNALASPVGDAGLNAIDGFYSETFTFWPAITGLTGTGAAVTTAIDVDVFNEETQPAGTYTDTVNFVVVWP